MNLTPFQKTTVRDLVNGCSFGAPEPLSITTDPITGTMRIEGGGSLIHEPSIAATFSSSGWYGDLQWEHTWMPTEQQMSAASAKFKVVESSPSRSGQAPEVPS